MVGERISPAARGAGLAYASLRSSFFKEKSAMADFSLKD
jgi:hypothetical protein